MNNPNRTRDHLANERTFLAWIRTVLALLGVSVVLLKLRFAVSSETDAGLIAGLAIGGLGLSLVPVATWNYFRVQSAIEHDTFQPGGRSVWILAALIFAIGVGILVYLARTPAGAAGVIALGVTQC